MNSAAKWLRRVEIVLMVTGISFLGVAFAATVQRWHYQARQEPAMLHDAGVEPVHSRVAADPVRGRGAVEPMDSGRAEDPVREVIAGDPLVLGRIEIPRIAVKAIIREGDDDATLSLAVGHIPGTARPGENGNAVLAGHRDTFFRELRNIRLNDRVWLNVPPHSYEYLVTATQVVAPSEISVLESRGAEELTLITCHPFNYIGSAPNRFIVRAVRVE